MKNYVTFIYFVRGQHYIDAYPLNNRPLDFINNINDPFFVSARSGNQARKAAYRRFVRPSGKGFNRLPRTPIYLKYKDFKRRNDARKSKSRHSR